MLPIIQRLFEGVSLSSGNRSQHNKRLPALGDGVGERGVGWVVGEVFFVDEEAQAYHRKARRCCVSWLLVGRECTAQPVG